MRRFTEWLLSLPLPAHFAVSTILFTIIFYLLNVSESNYLADSLARDLFKGSALAALATGVWAVRRRRYGGAKRLLDVAAAVRTGRLPVDADRLTWAPLLEKKKRSFRRLQLIVAVECVVPAAFLIWPAVTGTPMLWLASAAFLAAGVAGVISGRRYVARIERMQRDLGLLNDREDA